MSDQITTIIGLSNLHYAIMESDTTSAASYATPVKIGHAVSVDIQPQNQTAKLYGDNILVDSLTTTPEYNVTIETTDLPLSDQAALLGHTYESDTLTVKSTDLAPNVALLFEAEARDGSIIAVKLFKGKFSQSQETINTRGESLSYQVPQLTAIFSARIYDNKTIEKKKFAKGSSTTSWYATV